MLSAEPVRIITSQPLNIDCNSYKFRYVTVKGRLNINECDSSKYHEFFWVHLILLILLLFCYYYYYYYYYRSICDSLHTIYNYIT